MGQIAGIHARQILDSRGNPTVEVEVFTEKGSFKASVPSGASTGIHEAIELRDQDNARYSGKGVLKAVKNVNAVIAPMIKGMDPVDQAGVDDLMIEKDGTKNKSVLGANAILAVSMAVCRAGAAEKGVPLYEHISNIAGMPANDSENRILPVPSFNVINGGEHAGNGLAMQEFMILPVGAESFSEAMRMGAETYHILKGLIKERYGKDATNVGDEGGFAPNISDNKEALEILSEAIEKAGYSGKIKIGMDIAASEFYIKETGKYDLGFKLEKLDKQDDFLMKSGDQMIDFYKEIIEKYGIVSIEDPFDQDDWESYSKLTALVGKDVQIVGDDLLVTNPERIKEGIEKNAANALLLKVNQIGSVTEAISACLESKKAGWGVMVSHRSGETEDTFIADLAVGIKAGQIKTGAPCRSERLAKYNQLLRIEESLGEKARYAGKEFRFP